MRAVSISLLLLAAGANAFMPQGVSPRADTLAANMYVPDGFTAESYKKFKAEEAKKKATKNLGKLGPRGFQS
eukprot:Sro1850_g301540.1 n/a (71) ;mRNA; r:2-216